MTAGSPLDRLHGLPTIALGSYPTPVEELAGLRRAIGAAPRLSIKRDDAIPFGFGGNKVRKAELVLARAVEDGADTILTIGGVQSNHARVTAAASARLGLDCHLVLNGTPLERPTANALVETLVGAHLHYVATREERGPAADALAARLRREGRRVAEIPLGASTPLGAMAYARAFGELLAQGPAPDVIVHASSSGGTQAGLLAGCALFGVATRVIGVSADEPAGALRDTIASILQGIEIELKVPPDPFVDPARIEVDDRWVGAGYGRPTTESAAALELLARTEALFLDPTYTAKAMAGLLARLRDGTLDDAGTVLFWHTGGQVTLFA